jgi:rSAM/selenodomain-associated transferase 1
MRRTLVLFVRAPVLGRGKRRLAREIGDVAAVRFERQMLALLLRRLAPNRRWRLRIAATPDRALRLSARRPPARIERVGQGAGDLGARMSRAIAGCPPGLVVLVGADIPALRACHIAAAFALLGARDLVFGPAEDGGFWLVGARRRQHLRSLFAAVRWSTRDALADVLANLPDHLAVGFVERLADVDDAEAYRRLAPRRGF